MFRTIREFYPHGIEGEETQCTFKEWETLKKAVAYARRYSSGLRFVSCTIEDEQGNIVYELLADGRETWDNKDNAEEMKQDGLPYELAEKTDTAQEMPELPKDEAAGKGEFDVKVQFESGEKTAQFRTKHKTMMYAMRVQKELGNVVRGVEVRHGHIVLWQWHGKWIYSGKRDSCLDFLPPVRKIPSGAVAISP